MKKANILVLLFLTFTAYPQNRMDPWEYFPHHAGDIWEYSIDSGIKILRDVQISESIDSIGRTHIIIDRNYLNPINHFGRDHYILDSLYQVWYQDPISSEVEMRYKVDARLGEPWIVSLDCGGYTLGRITQVEEKMYFGDTRTLLHINYYTASSPSDTSGVFSHKEILASKFGRVYSGEGNAAFESVLKGAVIEGVLYGDTTHIITGVVNADPFTAGDYELLQNYPNPFNGGTIIPVHLNTAAEITLNIFSITGEKVRTLYSNQFTSAGTYTVRWDSKNDTGNEVPSGIYLYRISVNNLTQAKKLIVVR